MSRNKSYKGKDKKDVKDKAKHTHMSKPRGGAPSVNDISKLNDTERDNNPNWYFLDARVADQVSQMSFQQLAGYDLKFSAIQSFPVSNIICMFLNPSPGVQYLVGSGVEKSAINLAGFRLYTKLAAYTGRTATYGPQDISTMILAQGSIISRIEWIRRAFGIAFQMNMRNRAYPRQILSAMGVDPDNLAQNLASYRTWFNTLITMVNQIPIPSNIAYFDKCASLYEKIYLDSPSPMAQTIIPNICTEWLLDESTYAGGTVLRTDEWCYKKDSTSNGIKPLSFYLTLTQVAIDALLNSSTLQVVYTDLLNLANKVNTPFWQFDYIATDYVVVPEYNENFMLQFHNATIGQQPSYNTLEDGLNRGFTPYNDVYPDAANNMLLYNPTFHTLGTTSNGYTTVPYATIIDMLSDNVTVEDRIEVTRFVQIDSLARWTPTGKTTDSGGINFALPDHYLTDMMIYQTDGNSFGVHTNLRDQYYSRAISALSNLKNCPHFYHIGSNDKSFQGEHFGDLNFYTVVDFMYMRPLHEFVGFGLYDLR